MSDQIDNAVEQSKNRMLIQSAYALGGTLSALFIGVLIWVGNELMASREFRQSTRQNETFIFTRLGDLESGRTSRMAIETRAELNAIWRELGYKPAKDAAKE